MDASPMPGLPKGSRIERFAEAAAGFTLHVTPGDDL
jgi:hypothetical protein